MKYSKNDLKAINIFALILFGVGLFFLITGIISLSNTPGELYAAGKTPSISAKTMKYSPKPALPVTKGVKTEKISVSPQDSALRMMLFGVVLLFLGGALNLGLRRVIRNKGEDVPDAVDRLE